MCSPKKSETLATGIAIREIHDHNAASPDNAAATETIVATAKRIAHSIVRYLV
jgi:hypothetical protein